MMTEIEFIKVIDNKNQDRCIRSNADFVLQNYRLLTELGVEITDEQLDYCIHNARAHAVIFFCQYEDRVSDEQFEQMVRENHYRFLISYAAIEHRITDTQLNYCIEKSPSIGFSHMEVFYDRMTYRNKILVVGEMEISDFHYWIRCFSPKAIQSKEINNYYE